MWTGGWCTSGSKGDSDLQPAQRVSDAENAEGFNEERPARQQHRILDYSMTIRGSDMTEPNGSEENGERGESKHESGSPNLEHGLRETLDHTIYLAKRAFKECEVQHGDLQGLCVAALLMRAMRKAHTINVLTKEDLWEEAETILRVLLEVSFVVCAIAKTPEYSKRYAATAFLQSRKRAKNTLRATEFFERSSGLFPGVAENARSVIAACESRIAEIGVRPIHVVDYAREAGLLRDYYSTYSALCASVHSGPEDLESYFHKDRSGKILAIGTSVPRETEAILATAIEAMSRILNAASKVLDRPVPELSKVDWVTKKTFAVLLSRKLESATTAPDSP